MKLLGDRFSLHFKKKEGKNMVYSRHLFSLKYSLTENQLYSFAAFAKYITFCSLGSSKL